MAIVITQLSRLLRPLAFAGSSMRNARPPASSPSPGSPSSKAPAGGNGGKVGSLISSQAGHSGVGPHDEHGAPDDGRSRYRSEEPTVIGVGAIVTHDEHLARRDADR